MPSAHVHGVAVNPADELVYLATHDGLFRYDDGEPTRVGPVIDLMGFTVAGPDHFYASGHPGPGVDLPEPVGLIESTNGGESWELRSRQGESDFHALTASSAGVVGFDGRELTTTVDGTSWRELGAGVTPHALAASGDGSVLVATNESGLMRSVDGGTTWAPVAGAPLLQVVDWAEDQTVVGVSPNGTVAVSTDAGATWDERARVSGSPEAVGASASAEGTLRILVVAGGGLHDSADGGETFVPLP
ncbi:exo-alpha-sialidase [Blastococcus sp. TF02A-26]|nr:exo-alpha-sialidase [Blastococcus sp. TF02A-26]